jgi:septum site-determining protein MinC
MMMLTVLEIRDSDCDRILEQIDRQLARAPGFFAGMPVLLSLRRPLPDLAKLCKRLRAAELFAVGVLDADKSTAKAAAAVGLGNLSSPSRAAASAPNDNPPSFDHDTQPASPPASVPEPAEKPAKTPSRLVTKPVRSGQQIYARGGDLVVAASVSVGAEVLADGHIHVYGALRGRALAGASGDTTARIFCRRFEPELVAIAGCYLVADAMDEDVRSKPTVVRLEHDNLTIELQE